MQLIAALLTATFVSMRIAVAITVVRDVLFLSVQVTTMMDVLWAANHSVAKSVGSGLSQK